MYKLAICEDDARLNDGLRESCRAILTELGVEHAISAFFSAEALEEEISSGTPFDVLLLDVMLPGKTGMELAKSLRARGDRVSVIFTTSMEEYLLEGYSVQPIQFLLKPVRRDALADALRTDLKLNHSASTVILRMGARTVVLGISDIRCVESQNHSVVLYLSGGRRSFPMTLSEAERLLPQARFCRCHNSFLVNMEHIEEIARGEITLASGERIPVGRKYYAGMQSAFVRYMNP
ncbi:MAG: LytTR family DNA-binding domain-containing protein [Clostridia bacterium]|nr:LytTR family DNA-binding domain-containing protein [Clostridia bacterium]